MFGVALQLWVIYYGAQVENFLDHRLALLAEGWVGLVGGEGDCDYGVPVHGFVVFGGVGREFLGRGVEEGREEDVGARVGGFGAALLIGEGVLGYGVVVIRQSVPE